ncbi:MAG: MOSC domain-containing protein [Osedax symbiont Rs1]|nr:MAG: MOSC domain-containing protein [Osedax symbiont Rs1]
MHSELIYQLQEQGFKVSPASMGENITTVGIKLLDLPTGTILKIGKDAQIEITGLRNPCAQLDQYQKGLTAAVLDKDAQGKIIRKAGVMGIVIKGGEVVSEDLIAILLPAKPHKPLEKV